jgi:hypothetical protein
MPVIGFLGPASQGPYAPYVAGFRQGLKEAGFIEVQNVAIEFRWAENQNDRLPALAAELVRRQVSVIATLGSKSNGTCHGYFFLSLPQSSSSSMGAWRCRSRIFWYASGTASDLEAACSASGNQVAIAGKVTRITMQTHWMIMNWNMPA